MGEEEKEKMIFTINYVSIMVTWLMALTVGTNGIKIGTILASILWLIYIFLGQTLIYLSERKLKDND